VAAHRGGVDAVMLVVGHSLGQRCGHGHSDAGLAPPPEALRDAVPVAVISHSH
jgi:hypothetical protein